MAKQTIEARVIQKVATEQEWLQDNLVLYKGEIALVGDESGVHNIKIGNGRQKFKDLPYMVDYVNGLYTGVVTPQSQVPSGINNVFLVSEPGTYTNFGGVILPKDNLGIIYKNGINFTIKLIPIVSEDKLQEYIDEKLVNSNLGFGGEITSLTQQPTTDGMYIPKVEGAYINFGNLTYSPTEGFVVFLLKDSIFSKVSIPLNSVEDNINASNEVLGVSGSAVEKYAVKKINTIAELRNTNGEYEGQIVELLGYYEIGDKEPLRYIWTTNQGVDDGGSVINSGIGSWVAQFGDEVSVLHYGARNNGVDDDYNAIFKCCQNHSKVRFGNNHLTNTLIQLNKSIYIDFNNSNIITSSTGGFLKISAPSKKQTELSAVYAAFQEYLEVKDATNINEGDLLDIVSTELFDPTRSYYYKQKIVKVMKVVDNRVFISEPIPFDINYLPSTITIYPPISVKLKNANDIKGQNEVNLANRGISLEFLTDSIIENIKHIGNYKIIIENQKNYNLTIKSLKTGHSIKQGDNYDGYGVYGASFNGMHIIDVVTNSGQHGVTTSGRGVCYNLTVRNSVLKGEIWQLGLGMHSNSYDADIQNSTLFGFLLAGNVIMKNIILNKDSTQLRPNNSLICYSVDNKYSNYYFENIDFKNIKQISVNESEQISSDLSNAIGSVVFRNCSNFYLFTNVRTTKPTKNFTIRDLTVDNCNVFNIYSSDKVINVDIKNCSNLTSKEQDAALGIVSFKDGDVDYITVDNVSYDSSTILSNIAFRFRNIKKAIFNNIKNTTASNTVKTAFISASSNLDVFLNNVDTGGFSYPIYSLSLNNISLIAKDSILKFQSQKDYISFINDLGNLDTNNTYYDIVSNISQSGVKNISTLSSSKYYYNSDNRGVVSKYKFEKLSSNSFNWLKQNPEPTIEDFGLVKKSEAVSEPNMIVLNQLSNITGITDLNGLISWLNTNLIGNFNNNVTAINSTRMTIKNKLTADINSGQQAT